MMVLAPNSTSATTSPPAVATSCAPLTITFCASISALPAVSKKGLAAAMVSVATSVASVKEPKPSETTASVASGTTLSNCSLYIATTSALPALSAAALAITDVASVATAATSAPPSSPMDVRPATALSAMGAAMATAPMIMPPTSPKPARRAPPTANSPTPPRRKFRWRWCAIASPPSLRADPLYSASPCGTNPTALPSTPSTTCTHP